MKKFPLLLITCSFLLGGVLVFLVGYHLHEKKTMKPPSEVFVDRQGVPIADRALTVDSGLQKITEEALENAFAILHPKQIIAILADPRTGKVLAMAKRSAPEGAGSSTPQGNGVSFCYEPGSTFKPLSCAGFLMNGLGDDKSQIFCENGAFQVGNSTIKDHTPLGNQTPPEILMRSSNIGAAKMALKIGASKYSDLVRSFGFGKQTGINLEGESKGAVLPKEKVDDLSLARMAFGESVSVTPLQILMAYGAIANGGILFHPSMTLDENATEKNGERIMPEAVAESLKEALKLAVSDQGTAPLAQVEGMQVAGKSGTSQAITPDGEYSPNEYVTSFAGYFPAGQPQVVVVVVVDRASVPVENNYGGLVAAPIFATIAENSAKYLNIR